MCIARAFDWCIVCRILEILLELCRGVGWRRRPELQLRRLVHYLGFVPSVFHVCVCMSVCLADIRLTLPCVTWLMMCADDTLMKCIVLFCLVVCHVCCLRVRSIGSHCFDYLRVFDLLSGTLMCIDEAVRFDIWMRTVWFFLRAWSNGHDIFWIVFKYLFPSIFPCLFHLF